MWIAFNSGLDVCYMDVFESLFSLSLLPRSAQKDCRGSMKMSYNLLPARAVSCERDCLLVLADLFCKFEKTTLSRLFFRNYSPLISLIVYLGR